MKSDKLQIVIGFSLDAPRVFDAVVCAPREDIQAAIDEGIGAFNQAFHSSLEQKRRAHATAHTDRAA